MLFSPDCWVIYQNFALILDALALNSNINWVDPKITKYSWCKNLSCILSSTPVSVEMPQNSDP